MNLLLGYEFFNLIKIKSYFLSFVILSFQDVSGLQYEFRS